MITHGWSVPWLLKTPPPWSILVFNIRIFHSKGLLPTPNPKYEPRFADLLMKMTSFWGLLMFI